MKRTKKILALIIACGLSHSIIAMDNSRDSLAERLLKGTVNTLGKATKGIIRTVNNSIESILERNRRNAEERERELHRIIEKEPKTSPIRQNAIQELDEVRRQKYQINQQINNFHKSATETLVKALDATIEVSTIYAKENAKRKTKVAKARIAAQANVERGAVQMHMFLNKFTNPVKVGGLALAVFGSYYGLKFGFQVLEDWYRVPTLADKTTIISWYKKFYNWFNGVQVFNNTLDDVILKPQLKAFFKEYVQGTKNIIKNDGHLNHLLLPGPPGTGKTMTSIAIANELDVPAIYFAASNLRNYKVEDAITKLRQLFTYAKKHGPIVIIMDEAELIFGSRDKSLGEEIRIAANKIMSETGTEQSDFILIALTNRVQDFDMAFKSRFNNIVEVGPPARAERKQLINMYVNKYIKNPKFNNNRSRVKRLFKKKPKNVVFNQQLFNNQSIERMVNQTNGFTGRNISHLIMEIRKKAFATADLTITQQIINSAIKDMKVKVAEEHRQLRQAK